MLTMHFFKLHHVALLLWSSPLFVRFLHKWGNECWPNTKEDLNARCQGINGALGAPTCTLLVTRANVERPSTGIIDTRQDIMMALNI